MLSTNAFFFSGSADSRFEVNLPVVEKAAGPVAVAPDPGHCHGSSPQMPRGPAYGDWEVPFVPKNRSVTSHQPLANWVEVNVTAWSLPDASPSLSGRPLRPLTAVALIGCCCRIQLQMSITWMFCSVMMSPDN